VIAGIIFLVVLLIVGFFVVALKDRIPPMGLPWTRRQRERVRNFTHSLDEDDEMDRR
jgi:hypothetical protein